MSGDPTKPPQIVWAWICVAVFMVSLLALAALQYAMPDGIESVYGFNHEGMHIFQQELLGHSLSGISARAFLLGFRLLLSTVWISYALALILGFRGSTPRPKAIISLIALMSVSLAVLWPASLSYDSFAYVAYARMKVLYGMNPYAQSARALLRVHDPSAIFTWDLASPYGSVWTLMTVALVAMLKHAGLWWQEIAMKLIEALALIGAAFAGRSIARRLSPGKENLALLAIGLNPLLLIEGPGNGHNDMLMTCLLLIAISAFLSRKWLSGGLWLGFSIGIKFVAIMALPWVVMECVRGKDNRNKPVICLAIIVLAIAPLILCYLPFTGHGSLLTGLHERWEWSSNVPNLASGGFGNRLGMVEHTISRGVIRQVLLAFIFLCLTLWLWIERKPGKWLAAWVMLSMPFICLTSGVLFPWYFIWPCAVSLACWDRLHIRLSAMCLVFAFLLSCKYTFTFLPR